ncbi:hypothetical protein VI817_007935 [Penicillium citrinum]|nr:hypothetical protein VI817_007935 [Penicillium citrinum]
MDFEICLWVGVGGNGLRCTSDGRFPAVVFDGPPFDLRTADGEIFDGRFLEAVDELALADAVLGGILVGKFARKSATGYNWIDSDQAMRCESQ